jgi:hypothetical protein
MDERSANAISMNRDSLLELHHQSVSDPECYYHQYKKSIWKICVEPIECVYYSNSKDTGNSSLYATYKYSIPDILEEILISLSPEEYIDFSREKGESSISNNEVKLDTYYAEGILNA